MSSSSEECSVRLVYYEHVGNLDNPLLDTLQFVPPTRRYQKNQHVHGLVYFNLTLPNPHSLHNNKAVPSCLTKLNNIVRVSVDAT
jgi:hypothetical protein